MDPLLSASALIMFIAWCKHRLRGFSDSARSWLQCQDGNGCIHHTLLHRFLTLQKPIHHRDYVHVLYSLTHTSCTSSMHGYTNFFYGSIYTAIT